MNQNVWGPYAWNIIHTIAAYDTNHGEPFMRFSHLTCNILPCKACADNCVHTKSLLHKENSLKQVWFHVHNRVNALTNKPQVHKLPLYQLNPNFYFDLRLFSLFIVFPLDHNLQTFYTVQDFVNWFISVCDCLLAIDRTSSINQRLNKLAIVHFQNNKKLFVEKLQDIFMNDLGPISAHEKALVLSAVGKTYQMQLLYLSQK